MLAQSTPEPEHHVCVCHGNKSNTLDLVVQQVAQSCHESLIIEATLLHDYVLKVRVDVDRLALPSGGCHLLHGLSHTGEDTDLLLHQDTPLPLPVNHRDMLKWLVKAVVVGAWQMPRDG